MSDLSHKNLIDRYPIAGVTMPRQVFDGIQKADDDTHESLGELWSENVTYNVTHYLPKYGWINDGYLDIGRNKAIICIGSGPSLAKNKEYLKVVSLADGSRDFPQQDFILMSANHQLKSCFEAGIIPHFAMIADASPDLASQMDVGKTGKHTTLIANLITSPEVIKAWKGPVKFVCPRSASVFKLANELLDNSIEDGRCVTSGGNIMNLSFSLGMGLFRASAWMCVGNDLSYPVKTDIKERRKGYYEDGDYATNIKSKRDEARNEFVWGGYTLPESTIWSPGHHIVNWELEWRYTASQLFFYKSWLETNCLVLWEQGHTFHLYNCTEGGILGVLLKENCLPPEKYDEKYEPENWFLLDEVPGVPRWHTMSLFAACEEFHDTKKRFMERQCNPSLIIPDAPYAARLDRQEKN